MERTMFLVDDARLSRPVVVDLFRVTGKSDHTYDYALHFRGQLIATDVKYRPRVSEQEPLGKSFGYQHIWTQAEASVDGPLKITR
jgi:hypothetical protein